MAPKGPPGATGTETGAEQATRKRGRRGQGRRLRREIERAASERQEAWRDGERRDVRHLTVDLNGKVSARETSDASETDARGDDGYLREHATGLFADLRNGGTQ